MNSLFWMKWINYHWLTIDIVCAGVVADFSKEETFTFKYFVLFWFFRLFLILFNYEFPSNFSFSIYNFHVDEADTDWMSFNVTKGAESGWKWRILKLRNCVGNYSSSTPPLMARRHSDCDNFSRVFNIFLQWILFSSPLPLQSQQMYQYHLTLLFSHLLRTGQSVPSAAQQCRMEILFVISILLFQKNWSCVTFGCERVLYNSEVKYFNFMIWIN